MGHILTLALILISSPLLAKWLPNDAENWVDSVYVSMTVEERVGQLFIVPYTDKQTALESIQLFHVSGFILPSGSPDELGSIIHFLKSNAKYPLWFAVSANEGTTPGINTPQKLPAAGTLHSLTNNELLEQIGHSTGELMAALGINMHIMSTYLPSYTKGMMKAGVAVITSENLHTGQIISLNDRNQYPIVYKRYVKSRSEADFALNAMLIRQSVDILVLDEGQLSDLKPLQKAVIEELKKKELKELTYKMLGYKWHGKNVADDVKPNLHTLLNRDQSTLLYQILSNSMVYQPKGVDQHLPIQNISNKFFASISMDNIGGKNFREGIERYVLPDHFYIENENGLTEKQLKHLSRYDWVLADLSSCEISSLVWDQIAKLSETTTTVVYINGSQINTEALPRGHVLWNYDATPLAYDIASQAIFGAIGLEGKWPEAYKNLQHSSTNAIDRLRYTFPEMAGMNSEILGKIDKIAEEAILNKATPGAQIMVVKNSMVVYDKVFGHHSYDSLIPVQKNSIFDIASLTKVVGTLQAIMFLTAQNKIDIEANLEQYFPELKGNQKGKILLRDILTHQAGLPSYYPFWRNTFDRKKGLLPNFYAPEFDDKYQRSVTAGLYTTESMEDSLWQWIISDKIKLKPAGKYLYSDIGFMMLKRLAEKELGEPLDQFLREKLHRPLGMYHTSYTPLCDFPLDQIVPTEDDKEFRMNIIRGHVHDQNAAMIGGVAGHAGMFSNANDLAKIMQMHLQGGIYGGHRYLSMHTTKTFAKNQSKGNRRGLGWDKPSFDPLHNNTSNLCSPSTFGHTGFTGVAAWADPEYELIYIFLSNRTFPDANNNKLNELKIRNRIHDIIYSAIISENNAGD